MARKVYSDEFKRAAVEQVVAGRHTASSVARRLGVGAGTLRKWVELAKFNSDKSLIPTDPPAEQLVRELQKENARELFIDALMMRASCLHSSGRTAQGVDALLHGLELARRWAAENSDGQKGLHRLSNVCWRLVELEAAGGRTEEARSILHDTLSMVKAARPPALDDYSEVRHAGDLRLVLGASLLMVKEPAEALTMLESAERYLWRALALSPTPDHPDHLLDLGDVYRYTGAALALLGLPHQAAGAFEAAIEEYVEASGKNAFHMPTVDVLGTTRLQCAHALADAGESAGAAAGAERGMRDFESLMLADKSSPKARTRYAASCWDAGRVHETLAHDPDSTPAERRMERERAKTLFDRAVGVLGDGPHQNFDAWDGGVSIDDLCAACDRYSAPDSENEAPGK